MPTISRHGAGLTLINVFGVDPANQQELVDLLVAATDGRMRQTPGFISASLHRSLDGRKVTMYAQWRSRADYDAMRAGAASSTTLARALEIATFEPGMYDVVDTFVASEDLADVSAIPTQQDQA